MDSSQLSGERFRDAMISNNHCAKQNTLHQVTTMLAIAADVLFPGHNHLLTTSTDDPTL